MADPKRPLFESSPRHRDFIILSMVALALIAIFIALTFRLIDQEDKHVADVGKIRARDPFPGGIENAKSDRDVEAMVIAHPDLQVVDFETFSVSNHAVRYLARLKQLKKLNIGRTKVTEDGLKYLVNLPIVELRLSGLPIKDKGMRYISRMTRIQQLDLSATEVGDDEMPMLEELPCLDNLSLSETHVTDKGVKKFLGLRNRLQKLLISFTKVTNACLPDLSEFERMRTISFDGTAVTARGLAKDFKNYKIQKLGMGGCDVTDDDIRELVRLFPDMRSININGTKVGDRGLLDLAKLNKLSRVEIGHCLRISNNGRKMFENKMPRCEVVTSNF